MAHHLDPNAPEPAKDDAARMRFLVVDASRHRRGAWRRVLEAAFPGCRVETAETGHDAWSLLRARPFDGILAESRLPDMSGLELMGRANLERPTALRVLLAHATEGEAGEEAVAQGRIHGYLPRDVPSADAAPTLRRIWGARA